MPNINKLVQNNHSIIDSKVQVPDQYFYQKQILKRGWSKKMIDELLGEPDDFRDNPHHPDGHSMRLYLKKRVIAIENSPTFNRRTTKIRSKTVAVISSRN